MVTFKEQVANRMYSIYINGSWSGEIFFHQNPPVCKVRFMGWGTGIPLEDLETILDEIKSFAREKQMNGQKR